MASRIDDAVRQIVQSCYIDTVKLVANHRDVMDRVVELLIEKETLDGEEFRAIVSEFTSIPEKERFSPLLGEDLGEAELPVNADLEQIPAS